MCLAAVSRGIYQIRRGICQILPRKTMGPTYLPYAQYFTKALDTCASCPSLVLLTKSRTLDPADLCMMCCPVSISLGTHLSLLFVHFACASISQNQAYFTEAASLPSFITFQ